MTEPDWNDFRFLLALSQGGSVAAAARLLAVDNSTVSRRLAAIEQALGAQLLLRGGREFSWTAEGRLAVTAAESMGVHALEVTRAIRTAKQGVDGVVRISCATGMASALSAVPKLARERYPLLTVEITGKMATVDLAKGDADIAVRMFKPTEADLIARRGVEVGWVVVAAEAYAREHGLPSSEAELQQHPLVLYDVAMLGVPGPRWIEERRGANSALVRYDNTDAASYAIAAGAGIGVTPYMTIHNRDGFVRVFPQPVAWNSGWIVYHQASRDAAKVHAVVDLLVEFFEANQHLFSGKVPETVTSSPQAP